MLAGICLGFVALVEIIPAGDAFRGLVALSALLGMVNTQLGLFNLIPGYPLDGGGVLKAGLWAWTNDFYRATSQAAFVGLVFGLGFGLIGALLIVGALSGTLSGSVASSGGWIVLIGAFLFAAARGSSQAGGGAGIVGICPHREVMVRPVVSLPPDLTLEEAVNCYFSPLWI